MVRWRVLTTALVLLLPLSCTSARAAGDPDELYRAGRFAEAEEMYRQLDMDRPKDLRHRYNRGCAAYGKGDDQAAAAAFSSVLSRSDDDAMRFKSSFNLGTIAYRQGDFPAAADWYRRALSYSPDSEDARYNLELALRKQAVEEESEDDDKESDEGDQEGQGGENQEQEEGEDSEGEQQPGESQEKDGGEKDQDGQSAEEANEEGEEPTGDPGEREKDEEGREEEAENLDGELNLAGADEDKRSSEPEEAEEESASRIDRQKAEALLDNMREDRSKFLRLQLRGRGEREAPSGKDW